MTERFDPYSPVPDHLPLRVGEVIIHSIEETPGQPSDEVDAKRYRTLRYERAHNSPELPPVTESELDRIIDGAKYDMLYRATGLPTQEEIDNGPHAHLGNIPSDYAPTGQQAERPAPAGEPTDDQIVEAWLAYEHKRPRGISNRDSRLLFAREVLALPRPPIDMILHCPACGKQHIDAADRPPKVITEFAQAATPWTNPPHRSHLCHNCGHIWRPADVPTNGVATIKTKGSHE